MRTYYEARTMQGRPISDEQHETVEAAVEDAAAQHKATLDAYRIVKITEHDAVLTLGDLEKIGQL